MKETRRFAPVIPVNCCSGGPAAAETGSPRPGREAVTCWGLGSARRGRGAGSAAPGAQGLSAGGGPALECTFLQPRRLCTGVENSLGWGFASSPPPAPSPARIPFQTRSESSQTCAGKFGERGASCWGLGQWKNEKAGKASRALLAQQTAGTRGVSSSLIQRWGDGDARPPPLAAFGSVGTGLGAKERSYFSRWRVFRTEWRAGISGLFVFLLHLRQDFRKRRGTVPFGAQAAARSCCVSGR